MLVMGEVTIVQYFLEKVEIDNDRIESSSVLEYITLYSSFEYPPNPTIHLKVRAFQRETKSRREEKRFGGLILICDTPRTKLSGSNESSLRLFLNVLYYFIFIIRILYRLQH